MNLHQLALQEIVLPPKHADLILTTPSPSRKRRNIRLHICPFPQRHWHLQDIVLWSDSIPHSKPAAFRVLPKP